MKYSKKLYRSLYIYISSRISLFIINHIIVVTARPNMTIELSFIMKFVS